MQIEMMRTFPVPRQQGWDYLEEIRNFPESFGIEVIDLETSSWDKPGDTIQVAGKMLGIRLTGTFVLEEKVVAEYSRRLARWRGEPEMHVEQHYEEAGPGAFTLRWVVYLDEKVGRLGQIAAWLQMKLPFAMPRELRAVFDHLDRLCREGVTDRKNKINTPAAEADEAHKTVMAGHLVGPTESGVDDDESDVFMG